MAPQRIGLLGGSFNPAHAGHLHISQVALKQLGLDEVWWLVSPQNPLKPRIGMAPYAARFASALGITRGEKHILISDFEARAGLHYTHATLKALVRRYRDVQFVWLMGADNLAGFHRWQHWRDIVRLMPVAVFDRAPFSHQALHTRAALALRPHRLQNSQLRALAGQPGKWGYLLLRRHPASSTAIRAEALKRGVTP